MIADPTGLDVEGAVLVPGVHAAEGVTLGQDAHQVRHQKVRRFVQLQP